MPPRKSATAQDKPFTFKARSGVITIPAKEVYDPSMEAIRNLRAATRSAEEAEEEYGNQSNEFGMAMLDIQIATEDLILSGFSPAVSKKIKLSASEVETFLTAYQAHTGVNIPK